MNEMKFSAKFGVSKLRSGDDSDENNLILDEILLYPDDYIGSIDFTNEKIWIWDEISDKMILKKIKYVPALLKLFDDILVNAANNYENTKLIKINIDADKNMIKIYNDGKALKITKDKYNKSYLPTLMACDFGNDDKKNRIDSKIDHGVKLCNLFSKRFILETCSNESSKYFQQIWRDNMNFKTNPIITEAKSEDFTCIIYFPDLEKFKMKSLNNDIIQLLTRRAYDIAGCKHDVKVYLNDEKLLINNFEDYCKLYLDNGNMNLVYDKLDSNWEIGVCLSENGFQQISFVNCFATTRGGKHVDFICEQIVEYLSKIIDDRIKSRKKVKPAEIKEYLSVFVNCHIDNPKFNSPVKDFLTSQVKYSVPKVRLNDEFYKKLDKSRIADNIIKCLVKTNKIQLSDCEDDIEVDFHEYTNNGEQCDLTLTPPRTPRTPKRVKSVGNESIKCDKGKTSNISKKSSSKKRKLVKDPRILGKFLLRERKPVSYQFDDESDEDDSNEDHVDSGSETVYKVASKRKLCDKNDYDMEHSEELSGVERTERLRRSRKSNLSDSEKASYESSTKITRNKSMRTSKTTVKDDTGKSSYLRPKKSISYYFEDYDVSENDEDYDVSQDIEDFEMDNNSDNESIVNSYGCKDDTCYDSKSNGRKLFKEKTKRNLGFDKLNGENSDSLSPRKASLRRSKPMNNFNEIPEINKKTIQINLRPRVPKDDFVIDLTEDFENSNEIKNDKKNKSTIKTNNTITMQAEKKYFRHKKLVNYNEDSVDSEDSEDSIKLKNNSNNELYTDDESSNSSLNLRYLNQSKKLTQSDENPSSAINETKNTRSKSINFNYQNIIANVQPTCSKYLEPAKKSSTQKLKKDMNYDSDTTTESFRLFLRN